VLAEMDDDELLDEVAARGLSLQKPPTGDTATLVREEITNLLRRMGCDEVGFMDDFAKHEVLLQFRHRGRPVQLRASAKGWAALYVKAHPFGARSRGTRAEYEARALRQGLIAVNSILRDWVKGQVVAVECGMMTFEAVFMAHVITSDGRPLIERVLEAKLLPPPAA
jgi:hypothetical protein